MPSEYFRLCTQALMPDSVFVGKTDSGTPSDDSPARVSATSSSTAPKRPSQLSKASEGPGEDIPGGGTAHVDAGGDKRMRSFPSNSPTLFKVRPSLLLRAPIRSRGK